MTNYTNYSYGTIPGSMENDADHGEKNTTTKKDETVRMKKKGGVVSGVLGVLCLALFVIGYGSKYCPRGGTTAVRSSIVPVSQRTTSIV